MLFPRNIKKVGQHSKLKRGRNIKKVGQHIQLKRGSQMDLTIQCHSMFDSGN